MKRHEKIHPDPLKDSWNGAKKVCGDYTFQVEQLRLRLSRPWNCFSVFSPSTRASYILYISLKWTILQATGKSAYKRKRGPWQQCLWYQRGAGAGMHPMASIANRDVFSSEETWELQNLQEKKLSKEQSGSVDPMMSFEHVALHYFSVRCFRPHGN